MILLCLKSAEIPFTLKDDTLSEEDLRELGVHIRLHRVRLLKVIRDCRLQGVQFAAVNCHAEYSADPGGGRFSYSNNYEEERDYELALSRTIDSSQVEFSSRDSLTSPASPTDNVKG